MQIKIIPAWLVLLQLDRGIVRMMRLPPCRCSSAKGTNSGMFCRTNECAWEVASTNPSPRGNASPRAVRAAQYKQLYFGVRYDSLNLEESDGLMMIMTTTANDPGRFCATMGICRLAARSSRLVVWVTKATTMPVVTCMPVSWRSVQVL